MHNECDSWSFSEETLSSMLLYLKQVSPTEAYAKCYYYPCWHTGEVTKNDSMFNITIYAASNITLSNNDTTLHFILEEPSEFFLDACDCCEG